MEFLTMYKASTTKHIEHGEMAAVACIDSRFQGTTTDYLHRDQHQPSIDSLLHRLRQLVPQNAITVSKRRQEVDCCWEVNVIRDTAAYIHYLYSEVTGSTLHLSLTGLSDSASHYYSTKQLMKRKFHSKQLPRSG